MPGRRRARATGRQITMLERVGTEAFDGERFLRPGRWAVAFLAEWCPFCREFEPDFSAMPHAPGTSLVAADVSSLSSPLWDRFEVEVVPTVVIFEDGRPVFRVDSAEGEGLDAASLTRLRAALTSTPSGPSGRPRVRD